MSKRTAILLALLMSATAANAAAQTGTPLVEDLRKQNERRGTRGAAFLEIGMGARAAALAGAVAADVRGVPALYWNTAGIAHAGGVQVGFSVAQLYADFDITAGQVGGILPVGGGVVGLSVNFLSSGDIERTTVQYPQGDDPLQGEFFSYTGTAVSLHYGRTITDRLALGGAIRVAQEAIPGASARYFGLDVGTQFVTGIYGTTIGASITNIGTEGRFRGEELRNRAQGDFLRGFTGQTTIDVERRTSSAAMPTTFRFSVLADLIGDANALLSANATHRLRLLTDVSDGIGTAIQGSIAIEYGLNERFFVRGGKRFYNEGDRAPWDGEHGLGLGGGLRIPVGSSRVALDYAYQPWGELGNTQMFSFEFGF